MASWTIGEESAPSKSIKIAYLPGVSGTDSMRVRLIFSSAKILSTAKREPALLPAVKTAEHLSPSTPFHEKR